MRVFVVVNALLFCLECFSIDGQTGANISNKNTDSILYFTCLKRDLLGNCEQYQAELKSPESEVLHSSLYKVLYQNKSLAPKAYQRRALKRLFIGNTDKEYKLSDKRFTTLVELIRNIE